jgi:curved DNA-binding protein CbpA
MSMKQNYYQILEVQPDASGDKIKEQYRFLVQAWHPDKFSKADQKARAEEKIKAINAAYDLLKDPSKRAEYDQKLRSSKKTEPGQPPPPPAQPRPAATRPVAAPPKRRAPARSKGLFGSVGVFGGSAQVSGEQVRVFINGRAHYLGVDELAHGRVQYFLNGENKGIVDFNSRRHVQAAVNTVVVPNGYEIHVLRLAAYGSRPEMFFTPKVLTAPRR